MFWLPRWQTPLLRAHQRTNIRGKSVQIINISMRTCILVINQRAGHEGYSTQMRLQPRKIYSHVNLYELDMNDGKIN